jgi:hypothetical protein
VEVDRINVGQELQLHASRGSLAIRIEPQGFVYELWSKVAAAYADCHDCLDLLGGIPQQLSFANLVRKGLDLLTNLDNILLDLTVCILSSQQVVLYLSLLSCVNNFSVKERVNLFPQMALPANFVEQTNTFFIDLGMCKVKPETWFACILRFKSEPEFLVSFILLKQFSKMHLRSN